MVLPVNRAAGDPITSADINAIAADTNTAVTRTADFAGGLSGQFLAKASDAAYDYTWQALAGGGGGGASPFITVAASNTPVSLQSGATYVCDGTADQEELQAALDDLPASGGWVQALPGNFNLTAPVRVEKHGVLYAGSGMGSVGNASQLALGTRFTVSSGFSGAAAILVQLPANDVCVSSVTLRDFMVDGADVAGGQHGVFFKAHTSTMERVRVSRMSGDGIRVEGYATWASYDTTLTRCYGTHNTGSGFHLSTNAQDDHLLGCIAYLNGDAGIRVRGASHQFTSCHTYNNTKYGVWWDNNGSRSKVVNLKCEGNEQHGMFFDNATAGTSNIHIADSNFKNNGEQTTNTYDHINFGTGTSGHSRNSIANCDFSSASPTGGNLPRYCINAPGSAVQNVNITGNTFPGQASVGTAILNVGSTAVVTTGTNAYGSAATGVGEARGIASVANGGTITINLAKSPGYYTVTPTVAGQVAVITAVTATTMTVSLQTNAGAAVTTAANVTYEARI